MQFFGDLPMMTMKKHSCNTRRYALIFFRRTFLVLAVASFFLFYCSFFRKPSFTRESHQQKISLIHCSNDKVAVCTNLGDSFVVLTLI